MLPGPGVCVMKLWMRERDQLIEQTMAFVEGVAAAGPSRARTAVPPPPEASRQLEPPRIAGPAKPAAPYCMVSERAEIQQRVANFKAQQQKFQRAREAHYDEIFLKTRATAGNASPP
jgi:hypothetical protein